MFVDDDAFLRRRRRAPKTLSLCVSLYRSSKRQACSLHYCWREARTQRATAESERRGICSSTTAAAEKERERERSTPTTSNASFFFHSAFPTYLVLSRACARAGPSGGVVASARASCGSRRSSSGPSLRILLARVAVAACGLLVLLFLLFLLPVLPLLLVRVAAVVVVNDHILALALALAPNSAHASHCGGWEREGERERERGK